MKITTNHLKYLIKEELKKFLKENSEKDERMMKIFVDLHNSLLRREKKLGKKLNLVDDELMFHEILRKVQKEQGISVDDLYEELENYKDSMDAQMFLRLKDAFEKEFYEDSSEWLNKEPEDKEKTDREIDDWYTKVTGKPNLRLIKNN